MRSSLSWRILSHERHMDMYIYIHMYIIIFNPCKTTGYSTCVGDKSRSQRSRLRTWWRKTSALPGIVGDVRPFFGSLGIKPVPCLHTFPGIVELFFLGLPRYGKDMLFIAKRLQNPVIRLFLLSGRVLSGELQARFWEI